MLGILAVIASKILFVGIVTIWKMQSRAGANALSSLATYALSLPVFIGLAWWWYTPADIVLTPTYLLYLFAWVIPVFLYSVGIVFLYKYQSLTEQGAYTLGVSTAIGLAFDIFILDISYSLLTLATIGLFFCSGWVLTRNRGFDTKGLPLIVIIGIITGIALFQVLDFFLYKQGIALQGDLLRHIIIAQILLISSFTIIGGPSLLRSFRAGSIKLWQLFAIPALFIPAVLFEGFAISELPIAIMMVSAIIPVVLLSIVDIKNQELKFTRNSALALTGVLIGLALLQLSDFLTAG